MDKIKEFWNERVKLGKIAGSNDFLLKNLEQVLILNTIKENSRILEIGCGDGDTLIKLAKEKNCTGIGLDFAEGMVHRAKLSSEEQGCASALEFDHGKVPGLPIGIGEFDYALTERCLINLDSHETQYKAFLEIMSFLKPGGCYLMIESFVQGLERTNALRTLLKLERIDPPWHNIFLDENLVRQWAGERNALVKVVPFSSTYYFLSRVVYASLARDKGEELRYDSDINLLACKLPPIGDFGPTRLYLWQRLP
jgi:ubiquinone/menaquinone biosynthesis C-methylase UbiE